MAVMSNRAQPAGHADPALSLVARAEALAREAHRGQTDKAGHPYIEHPRRVATAVHPHGDQVIAAAWLHDVAEDTAWTIQRLAQIFPAPVVNAVDALTRRPQEPSHDYYTRVRSDPIALTVKLADIADNNDPGRLGQLPQATAHRLRQKYAAALRELSRSPRDGATRP